MNFNMKGFRTILLNAAIAGSVPAIDSLTGADWVEVVGPQYAMVIVALLNIGARLITNTAVFKSA